MLQNFAAVINNINFSHPMLYISVILQEWAEATCTQPRDPLPPTSLLHANFVTLRDNAFGFVVELNQGFHGGSSTSQPPYYLLLSRSKSYSLFIPLPQSRADPGDILFSICYARYFYLLHHTPIFSQIYQLGGQCTHVWKIVRQPWKLAGEMRPSRSGI